MSGKSKPSRRFLPKGLRILHEDEDILVVDKPAGMLTMGTDKEKTRTVYYALTDYVRKGISWSRERIFIVHRLDRDTSGLLVFARNMKAKTALQGNWKESRKKYLAIVHGRCEKEQDTITSYLAENAAGVVYSTSDAAKGKLSHTGYRVLRLGRDHSLLEVDPQTGRKNQIRVHLAGIGHPVVGDSKYGKPDKSHKRLALHAAALGFSHPASGKRLSFETPAPEYFESLLGAPAHKGDRQAISVVVEKETRESPRPEPDYKQRPEGRTPSRYPRGKAEPDRGDQGYKRFHRSETAAPLRNEPENKPRPERRTPEGKKPRPAGHAPSRNTRGKAEPDRGDQGYKRFYRSETAAPLRNEPENKPRPERRADERKKTRPAGHAPSRNARGKAEPDRGDQGYKRFHRSETAAPLRNEPENKPRPERRTPEGKKPRPAGHAPSRNTRGKAEPDRGDQGYKRFYRPETAAPLRNEPENKPRPERRADERKKPRSVGGTPAQNARGKEQHGFDQGKKRPHGNTQKPKRKRD